MYYSRLRPYLDARTLDMLENETKYQYLALPDDGLFPCGLRRILITGTYESLYEKLREQDKLYIDTAQLEPLISLSHSTIITGQPGTGEPVALGNSVPLNNGATSQGRRPVSLAF
jgi:hypothetical protein